VSIDGCGVSSDGCGAKPEVVALVAMTCVSTLTAADYSASTLSTPLAIFGPLSSNGCEVSSDGCEVSSDGCGALPEVAAFVATPCMYLIATVCRNSTLSTSLGPLGSLIRVGQSLGIGVGK
jgi:hypothetical protein